jgi:hypothetical protein
MATEERRKGSDEGEQTDNIASDTRPDAGDAADRAQGTEPNAEVKRQIDSGEENAA